MSQYPTAPGNWGGFLLYNTRQVGDSTCTVIYMNINGVQIPAFMIEIIKDHMTTLIQGGMEANVETLHYAVALANQDVQGIGTQMLAGNYRTNADEIRDAVAGHVYRDLGQAVAA